MQQDSSFNAFEPSTPSRPSISAEAPRTLSCQEKPRLQRAFSNDANLYVLSEDQLDKEFNDWISLMPNPPQLLYVVLYDDNAKKYVTFSGLARKKLVRQYLLYKAYDARALEYASIHAAAQEVPEQQLRKEGQSYSLVCIEKECGHQEIQLSVKELKVRMFLHHLIEHHNASQWYQDIDSRIKETFEEALEALGSGTV